MTNLLPEQVAKTIRAQIIQNVFKIGQPLPSERILAVQLGVSRGVLREGLQLLESQGYLSSQPGKRRIVIQSTIDTPAWLKEHLSKQHTTIADLLETRYIVEPELARLSCERAGPAVVTDLQTFLDNMEMSLENPFAYIQHDRDFHLAVAIAARNPILEMIMASTLEFTTRLRLLLVQRAPQSIIRSHAMHKAILAAIMAHNSQAAAHEMREHVAQVQSDVLNLSNTGLLDPLDWPLD